MSDARGDSLAIRLIAQPIGSLRDRLAAMIVKAHISPNMLTAAGTVFSIAAGFVLARGAEQTWRNVAVIPAGFWAGLWLVSACAMDMLDGAVARIADARTPFGGIFDSTMDRISDIAVFGGIALAYGRIGNVTFQLLALIAMTNAIMISYIKARVEVELDDCKVGFWQRGERMVTVLIGCFAGNVATMIVVMAAMPTLTAAGRLLHCRRQLCSRAADTAKAAPEHSCSVIRTLLRQCHRRGSWPHVVTSAIYILILVAVRAQPRDFLRPLFYN